MEVRDKAVHFEAVKVALRQTKDGLIASFAIDPVEAPRDLINSLVGTRYMVALVEIGDNEEPKLPREKTLGERAVISAGMLCRDARFQRWLSSEVLDTIENETQASLHLRGILGIDSRAELAHDENARKRFEAIRESFMQDVKDGKV